MTIIRYYYVFFAIITVMAGRKKIILNISIFLIIPVVIYFVIASVMIIVGKPNKTTTVQQNLDFKELYFDYSNLPELKSFKARDGKELNYRYYPAKSDKTVILLHGSGWHSQYFYLWQNLSAQRI